MLFYVSLFVVSIIVASLAVWLIRALFSVGHSTYRAILPSAREAHRANSMARAHLRRLPEGEPPVPWGWGKKPAIKQTLAESYATASNGGGVQRQVGWPYRDEPFDLGGKRTLKDAKAGDKVVSQRKASIGGVEKPWGW